MGRPLGVEFDGADFTPLDQLADVQVAERRPRRSASQSTFSLASKLIPSVPCPGTFQRRRGALLVAADVSSAARRKRGERATSFESEPKTSFRFSLVLFDYRNLRTLTHLLLTAETNMLACREKC